jgi:hypothetical protein
MAVLSVCLSGHCKEVHERELKSFIILLMLFVEYCTFCKVILILVLGIGK